MEVRQLRAENMQLRATVAVYQLSMAVASSLDTTMILRKAATAALQVCHADEVSIILFKLHSDEAYIAFISGEERAHLLGAPVSLERSIVGWVAHQQEPLILYGTVEDARFAPVTPRADIHTALSVPLRVGGRMVGVLNLNTTTHPRRFPAGEVKALDILAGIVASALINTQLYTQLQEAHRTLEIQVQERTAALTHTNETLRHEIAERQRAEAALRREEEYFRALIEHATDIIGILSQDGTVRYLSPSITPVLGYQPVELLGAHITTLIHPDDLPGLQDTLPRFLSTPGVTMHLEYQVLHKDGSFRALEVVGHNLLLNPAVAGVVINARDITERKEAARLKDDLLSVVSHELRTPLTSMLGFTDLLLTQALPADKQQHFLTIIHKETVRLSHLINDFLDLQRIQAGRQVYQLTPTDLAAVLRDMVSVFTQESASHVIRLEGLDDLPAIHADTERLCQVLANLLSNAIKFSPHGGEVTVGARAQGTQVLVWVADHGLGIPPEAVPQLFSKFYRVEHHETRHIRGTGLGLALVKEIVEAHNGSVWVESVLGQGSTFFFTVPVAPPAYPELARDNAPSAAATPSGPGEGNSP
jgi:PAS domain S-box-containing protein